jgi:thioredoxin reductase
MNDTVDVAIVGAGPYGLSLAAHLRHAGVPYRQFGIPMSQWQKSMPRGMYLTSQGFASNLSDPDGAHTLRQFCWETGRTYREDDVAVPLETFVSYGHWFRLCHDLHVEEIHVTEVTRTGPRRFELILADGQRAYARNVVVATGVEHFAQVPGILSDLPRKLCSHSSQLHDPVALRGREVVVVGAGQSALESAALLHESGVSVRLLARASRVVWNGPPPVSDRSLARRWREPEAELGAGWATWFYSRHPRWFRYLPARMRVHLARTALGPAAAWWLRDRVERKFPLHLGHSLQCADSEDGRARLSSICAGKQAEFSADHVISATGYPPDLRRLPFLEARLRSELAIVDRTPRVGRDFQSSIPGLFFVGAVVAPSFGPVMRFVCGADYAARRIANRLAATCERKVSALGGIGR